MKHEKINNADNVVIRYVRAQHPRDRLRRMTNDKIKITKLQPQHLQDRLRRNNK